MTDAALAPASTIGRLTAVAAWLAALTGWRRIVAAALLGGLATLALPPAYVVPALFVAFSGLLWLLDGVATRRGAFVVGWCFGFFHFLIGLYWVSFALLVDIARFWWLMPVAVTGLPILLAIFPGLATLFLHATRLSGLARVLAFAVLWTIAEWLRGHVFTGFPWNLIGYSWAAATPMLQMAAVTGIYGLSLLTVAVAALPAALADPAERRGRVVGALALGLALLGVIAGAGALRLAGAQTASVPGVVLRLVQPNIDQKLKFHGDERLAIFQRLLELSQSPGAERVTDLLWPETAVPFLLDGDLPALGAIGMVTPPNGVTLTGAPWRSQGTSPQPRYHNSLLAIDHDGTIVGTYDKAHLVPFGEYMPLRRWLPIEAIAAGSLDFTPGPGPRTLHLPGLPPVGPLICYEAIFPRAVADEADRPAWLLNLTNDGWYGRTAGPHQHFAIAAVRAVEEGVPLVRAANTGISGVVDPYGRVVAHLGLGVAGVLDATLPAAIDAPPYARFGDRILVVLLIIFSLGVALARQRG
jgi:apolipoprotein N-acyltransferase